MKYYTIFLDNGQALDGEIADDQEDELLKLMESTNPVELFVDLEGKTAIHPDRIQTIMITKSIRKSRMGY